MASPWWPSTPWLAAARPQLGWSPWATAVALWLLFVAVAAARVLMAAARPYRYVTNLCIGDGDACKVMVSEVTSMELRGSIMAVNAKRLVAARAVDIQPAAEMMAMRAADKKPRGCGSSTASVPITPRDESSTTASPVAHAFAMDDDAAATADGELRMMRSSGGAYARRWKVSGWMVLCASMLALCGPSHSVAAAADVAGYIVLVGIPVLDRVLPLKNLAQELLQRGYHVGFALPENCRHWVSDIDHLEFISLGDIPVKPRATVGDASSTSSSSSSSSTSSRSSASSSSSSSLDVHGFHSADAFDDYTAMLQSYAAFQRPMFAALVDDLEEDRPQLVVVDRYAFAGFDACHKLHLPYVVNSPSLLLDLDSPPAYIPAPFSNSTMHTPSVLDRCMNVLLRLRFRLAMVRVFREVNLARRDHGLPAVTSKDDLYGHQLVLVNSMFGLDEARPLAPQFQMVGMLEPTRATVTADTLHSPGFASWLARDAATPVVFISFPADTPLAPEFVAELLHGLETVAARLVWRISLQEQAAFDLRSRPQESVYFVREVDAAMDESRILQLTPISLLITAGSFYAVQQAFALGVPVLGTPFSAEQRETMDMVVRTGSGLQLHRQTFNQHGVFEAAQALLQKPQYAAAAFRLGEVLKCGGGTKRAADHVESVLEFGAAHVLPARNLQPLYKTFLVDVYLVYGAILFCSAIVLRSLFSALYHILQLAPDVHLGVALDDEVDDPHAGDGAAGADGGHHDVHKPQQVHNHHGQHHHHHSHNHNHNHHASHGKDKDV